ncbi:MAG: hypothetical protein QOE70_2832 [Chthoniobacter sp.]|nr:hypothetical protein [Chthoniobacter sp.]
MKNKAKTKGTLNRDDRKGSKERGDKVAEEQKQSDNERNGSERRTAGHGMKVEKGPENEGDASNGQHRDKDANNEGCNAVPPK